MVRPLPLSWLLFISYAPSQDYTGYNKPISVTRMSHEKHCSGTCQLLLLRLFTLFRTEAVIFLLVAQQSFHFYGELYAHVLLNQFVVYQWPARYPLSLQKFRTNGYTIFCVAFHQHRPMHSDTNELLKGRLRVRHAIKIILIETKGMAS